MMRPTLARLAAALCLAVAGTAAPSVTTGLTLGTATGAAAGAGRSAPEARATIRPGVQMFTRGAQCTGNFVFTDDRRRVYVGYAAHCAATGDATQTNGCRARSRPLGTRARFARGADALSRGTTVGRGRLVYSSWRTMQRRGVRGSAACFHNDFALVRVGRRHVAKVNPTVPHWGGPTRLNRRGVAAGAEVHSYGSSSLRPGSVLSPRTGRVVQRTGNGWSYDVYTVTPGVPGDSGSGYLDARGRAVGVLSTLAVAPLAGSNGVSDLRRQLRYAQRWSGIPGLRLVRGTRGFSSRPS